MHASAQMTETSMNGLVPRNPLALALAVLLASLAQVSAEPAKLTVYRGAQLIDGTGASAKPDMDIVVEGERIRAVVPDAAADNYARGAKVVDVHGLYAIPGLVDSHVHLATSPNRRYAEALLRRDV